MLNKGISLVSDNTKDLANQLNTTIVICFIIRIHIKLYITRIVFYPVNGFMNMYVHVICIRIQLDYPTFNNKLIKSNELLVVYWQFSVISNTKIISLREKPFFYFSYKSKAFFYEIKYADIFTVISTLQNTCFKVSY